ncbi:MAG: hypothetical protein IJ662_03965, partial [Clostridia bacterium]|nr:hypothetical protein [Clostridia bacterium]
CCTCYDRRGTPLFQFPAPPNGCDLAAGGGVVYCLSGDADSVTAYAARDGELLFSAPAGAYPRALALGPDGQCLAAAGGAAGEILLFDPGLRLRRTIRVPGVACGVCFLGKGMAALCAVGDGELSSALFRISPWGVTEEIFTCPQGPCCLQAVDNGCAVGCHGAVYFLTPEGRVQRALPCAYPARIRRIPGGALICDPWQGQVLLRNGKGIHRGPAPEDALLEY